MALPELRAVRRARTVVPFLSKARGPGSFVVTRDWSSLVLPLVSARVVFTVSNFPSNSVAIPVSEASPTSQWR